jgi:hypothetical protein
MGNKVIVENLLQWYINTQPQASFSLLLSVDNKYTKGSLLILTPRAQEVWRDLALAPAVVSVVSPSNHVILGKEYNAFQEYEDWLL